MKFIKALVLVAVFSIAVLAQSDQNPASFLCDYHNVYFAKQGQEYPSGKCYDVYTSVISKADGGACSFTKPPSPVLNSKELITYTRAILERIKWE